MMRSFFSVSLRGGQSPPWQSVLQNVTILAVVCSKPEGFEIRIATGFALAMTEEDGALSYFAGVRALPSQ